MAEEKCTLCDMRVRTFRIAICWCPNVVSKSLKDISTGEKLGGAHEIESQEEEEKKGGWGKFWFHRFHPLLPLNHWVHHLNPLFCHISNYLTTAKSGQVKNTRLSLKGSDLSPRIAVITPPQSSNPFTDLKPTFNQGLQKTLAREFLLNAQTCRCPVPAHQGEHQPFNRTEQKRERWENLPRGLQVRWFRQWFSDSCRCTYLFIRIFSGAQLFPPKVRWESTEHQTE